MKPSISAAKSGLAARFLRRALAGDGIDFLFRVLNLLASRLQIFSGVPEQSSVRGAAGEAGEATLQAIELLLGKVLQIDSLLWTLSLTRF